MALGESELSSAGRPLSGINFGAAVPVLRKVTFGFIRDWLPPMAIIAMVIGAWQFASTTGLVKEFVLPPPSRVVDAFIADWDLIVKHARPTLTEALLGFMIGNTLAVSLSILFVHSSIA